MNVYGTEQIRNVVLLGHGGAGKTTVAEALALVTGVTKRMGKVELTILRLALYEIKHDDDVPEKVAINEAVELAKKFGGDDSPAFINGILAKIGRASCRERV